MWNPIPIDSRVISVEDRKITFPAINYIAIHLHEKISLNTVSKLCNLNSYEFSRIFKRENSVNFQAYLIQQRIEKAAILLQYLDSNISDIAFSVGFNNSSYFTRMFRRYMEITPKEYKNKNRLGRKIQE